MLRPAGRGNDGRHLGGAQGRARPRQADQLDLHDVAFGRARLADPDAPARRHARPDGQAVGRDHREPDHLQLQGGPVGSGVLQFDPRRPQGPRGHRVEDRELRLSHPPPRRRGAGFDHHHARLRLEGRHQHARDHRRRHGGRLACVAHSRPHLGRHAARRRRQGDRRSGPDDRRRGHAGDHRRRHSGGEDPLSPDLRGQERRLRRLLRPGSRARHPGQHGRGGRRHRRPVDRRAGHPADDAHLPHRRRSPARGSVVHRVELRRRGEDPQPQPGAQLERRLDGDGAQRRRRHHRSQRGGARGPPGAVRRPPQGRRGRQDQARAEDRRVGSVHPAGPDRGRRRDRVRGPGRGRVDVGAGGRGDRHRQAHRHRLAFDASHREPQAGAGDQGQGRQDRQAPARRRRALCALGRIDHLVRAGRGCEAQATSSPASRSTAPRRATSPAVCRGWRSCSRRAGRRTMRSSPKSRARCGSGRTSRTSSA